MHISGDIKVIPLENGLEGYLLIHEKDTLLVCHNEMIYSQAEIFLFPGREKIDEMRKVKSSDKYKELSEVRKIRIKKRKKSLAIIDLGPKEVNMSRIPLEIAYYFESSDRLFISAVCKECDGGYRYISKSFSRKIIRALNSAEFKK